MSKATSKVVAFAERTSRLTETRNIKMASSAHAYVRGSTVKFYEWLEQLHRGALPEGPAVWICGDCHVGNLGPIASAEGELEIQIRDLDQTVIGNPAHDLIRLALSLAMAARSSDLPGVTTAMMLECMMEGYASAFERNIADRAAEMPAQVKTAMREAAGRSWKHLADERIEGVSPTIPLGKRFWPLRPEERKAIDHVSADPEFHRLVTQLRSRADDADIEIVDAAYWRKGCSSLGRLRFAVLVGIGKGKRRQHCLVDFKEAVASAAPRYEDAKMPRDNAERVVEGARHLSPFLGKRMRAVRLLDRPAFVRELLPQDLKVEIEQLTRDEAMKAAKFLATVVGKAHSRQMDTATRKQWKADLGRNRSDALDAPTWLWTSIVKLLMSHEGAYLEHCRQYALEAA